MNVTHIGYKARKMQRKFIFFTQYLGRVQLLSKNVEWGFIE
ncbi:hypothetical protein BWR56_1084 [Streptococcus oralis]|nr:hypothetical protein BWR56_1084 [Streptococcus oralis]